MWRIVPALLVLAACEAVDRKPNFIVILTDDQGYGDIGVHGNDKIRTPNLDQFARESVEFTRFYVEPVCAPTRAALMTGRYHYRTGIIHTSRGGAKMHGDEVTIAERLREAGYRTGLFGKWHLGDNYPMRPIDQGFELALWHKSGGIGQSPDAPNSYFDPQLWRNGEREQAKGYCTDVFFREALQFISDHRDEPFFVYLPTNAPHTPLEVPDELWKRYAEAGLDETTARVYGMVENIDANVKVLSERLVELGLDQHTYVIFLSDNGPQQRRYTAGLHGRKGTTYEGGIRALSFWRGPGLEPKKIDRIAAHIDLAPTLLDYAGIAAPEELDGRSLRPLLEGEPESWDRTHFAQVHRGLEVHPYQSAAVQTERWKLALDPQAFGDEDWRYDGEPPVELYDLQADPGEERDVATEHPDVVADLKSRYEAWFADVKASRNFTPGVIHLGSEHENPAVLCRYQDSTFVGGEPTSWSVEIESPGRYRFTVNTPETAPGSVHISWRGEERSAPGTSAEFEMATGSGPLEVWFQPDGGERVVRAENDALDDVTVERLK
jgi:arylsulfatase A-like enzyme